MVTCMLYRKYLIVAIGSECYVTLPKGQIIPTQSAANHVDVPGGGHVLIVPITHYPTYSTIPLDLAPPIIEETERYVSPFSLACQRWFNAFSLFRFRYKKALGTMYAKYNCVPVVFEVGRLSAKGGHTHMQVVPVPRQLKDKIEEKFVQEGRLQGIEFEEDPEVALSISANGKGSYFRVDLPDGRKLVHLMKENVPFNVQFGRCVPFFFCSSCQGNLHMFLGRYSPTLLECLRDMIGRLACFLRRKTEPMLKSLKRPLPHLILLHDICALCWTHQTLICSPTKAKC